jgi:malonate-semialdehyde dehydrogenase (acetylating) / methylmalonate-semialdehyde dehydrogenase
MMVRDYIGGQWTPSMAKESLPILNPASGKELARCPLGSSSDVDRAVQAAQRAYLTWRKVPAIERVQPLFRLKALLDENVEMLATCVTEEHGKTLSEARGSVRRAIQMVETSCGMPTFQKGAYAEDIAREIDSYSIRKPMGVFGGIAPFNFPAMVPFWFWPFAVAAGNTYVLKPSERVPLTQGKIFALIEKAGFPPGVINLVHGAKEVAEALCIHPLVKGINFVGSTPVARKVYTSATAVGKRVQSLGGAKNFMVVLPDAVLDKSVATALESITGCAGERCLAGSVVVCVGDETYSEVKKRMVSLAGDISVGDGLDPGVTMGPLISQEAKNRVIGLIESAEKEGAKVLLDGRKGAEKLPGFFLKPTVIADVRPGMRVSDEEIFGPVVLLGKVNSLDEAIGWINSSPFANTTTLFTTNGAATRKFCAEVDPSMIGINIGVPAPMSFFSFGGSKDSFFGDIKVHGAESVAFFTDERTITSRWHSDASIW